MQFVITFQAVNVCTITHVMSMDETADWLPADAEIKVPSVENPELTNSLPLKPGAGQNIAMHALTTARILYKFFHWAISSHFAISLT